MFGKNQKRAPYHKELNQLEVVSIFPTLQGEGIYTGYPCVFLRLAGCNLACHFCDTEFDNFTIMPVTDIIKKIAYLSTAKNDTGTKRNKNLVVITGGEPLRQNISLLCEGLLALGYNIQLESNGTIYQPLHEKIEIICSPKIVNGNYVMPDKRLLPNIKALKFIVSKSDTPYSYLPKDEVLSGYIEQNIKIYLQPMDEYNENKNSQNLEFCKNLCLEKGYILGLQQHKIIGVE